VDKRQTDIDKVAGLYGFTDVAKLDFPTTKLDQIPVNELISRVSKVISEVRPTIIYIPNRSDVHTDHQIASRAIMGCTKNFRYPFIRKILMYETLSETEFAPSLCENAFIPNIFVDITDYFHLKLKIMQVYTTEIMEAPFPRSVDIIEALARYRGSRIGVKYAETYMLLEEII
jgi:LmbE family N-acetylglucosaminyl deacetylase